MATTFTAPDPPNPPGFTAPPPGTEREPTDPTAVEELAGPGIATLALQTSGPKTGAHTHTCSKGLHIFNCQYIISCSLEMVTSPNGQIIIDILCPVCTNFAYGTYAR